MNSGSAVGRKPQRAHLVGSHKCLDKAPGTEWGAEESEAERQRRIETDRGRDRETDYVPWKVFSCLLKQWRNSKLPFTVQKLAQL